jgi:hypothetical protein
MNLGIFLMNKLGIECHITTKFLWDEEEFDRCAVTTAVTLLVLWSVLCVTLFLGSSYFGQYHKPDLWLKSLS